ncbi:MAG: glycosyltransferase [Methanosarcina sp.]
MERKFTGGGKIDPELKSKYLLITPAKNEEQNLPEVSKAIIAQNVKPALWVIVDDGSTDKTSSIIESLKSSYPWIQSTKLPPRPRDITFHYSYVCKQGFDYALEYCNQNKLEFGCIGLLDADTIIEENYFGKLLIEFEKDSTLGIASGGVYYNIEGKLSREMTDKNLPRGTGRLWKKDCFIETGGYLVEPSPDSISNIKAFLRGWKIAQYPDIVQIQTRQTSAASGLWHGYMKNGWMAYYLGKNFLAAMLNVFYRSAKYPYYPGIAYFWGYVTSAIRGEKRIQDPEIRAYYKNQGVPGLYSRVTGTFSRNSRNIEQREP